MAKIQRYFWDGTKWEPEEHTHNASDITAGTLGVARGGTGLSTVTANSYLKGNGTGALVPRTYTQVKNDLGLNNVENKSSATIRGEITKAEIEAKLFDSTGNLNMNNKWITNVRSIFGPDGGDLHFEDGYLWYHNPAAGDMILGTRQVGSASYFELNMDTGFITNLRNPTLSSDAATKGYVDGKAPSAHTLDSHTGTLSLTKGGTGATTAQAARTALGIGTAGTRADSYFAGASHTHGKITNSGTMTATVGSSATHIAMFTANPGSTAREIGAITPANLKTVLSLNNVENKSSATIRGEITSANVTSALGYTPYNSSSPMTGDLDMGAKAIENVINISGTHGGNLTFFGDGLQYGYSGGDVVLDKRGFYPELNMDTGFITNLRTPTEPSDAATKGYVDGKATGWTEVWSGTINLNSYRNSFYAAIVPLNSYIGKRIAIEVQYGTGTTYTSKIIFGVLGTSTISTTSTSISRGIGWNYFDGTNLRVKTLYAYTSSSNNTTISVGQLKTLFGRFTGTTIDWSTSYSETLYMKKIWVIE